MPARSKAKRTTRRRPKPAPKSQPAELWVHPKARPLPFDLIGPIVRLQDGRLVTVDNRQAIISRDHGKTWKPQPMFVTTARGREFQFRPERSMVVTRKGTIVLAFVNTNEIVWRWRDELHDILPGTRTPMYISRSTDKGRNWSEPLLLHEDWTGDLRHMIRLKSGRLVLSAMKMLTNPGRHGVLTYTSDDDGITWRGSNLIDLGGCGHHAGGVEATIVERNDSTVLMLLRTNWGRFWQAVSRDGGASWREIYPSSIEASSAPGQLLRLASGRLMLAWNRLGPEDGKGPVEMRGGDGIWSEVRASNYREELSIAFSEDDGESWSKPIVLARKRGAWLSYPRMLEHKPGDIWLTTMQGGLRLQFHEQDFL